MEDEALDYIAQLEAEVERLLELLRMAEGLIEEDHQLGRDVVAKIRAELGRVDP